MTRRIPIDGSKLRSDRKRKGYSGEALVATVRKNGGEISLKALYKAENDGLMSEPHLEAVASPLMLRSDLYRQSPLANLTPSPPDLRGKWRVLYLAQDDMTNPYVCEETLTINQSGQHIDGEYEPLRSHHPDPDEPVGNRSYWMRGKVEEKFVRGEYGPRDGEPTGNGYFILKRMQQGGVWEGVCTFFAMDERIATSINIWIKEDYRAFHSAYRQQLAKIQASIEEVWMLAPVLPQG